MSDSILTKAFRAAPLRTTSAVFYGLNHAPKLTLGILNGLAVDALGTFAGQLERRRHAASMLELMAKSGPWRFDPEIAQNVRQVFDRLPVDIRIGRAFFLVPLTNLSILKAP